MIIEWFVAAALTAFTLALIIYAPSWIEQRRIAHENIRILADEFFAASNKLVANKGTPVEVLQFLAHMNTSFGNPRLVRRIVWSAATGKLAVHAKNPKNHARKFLKAVTNMPMDMQNEFASAVACGLLASAEKSRIHGFVFLRFMLFDPSKQKLAEAPAYASELAATTGFSELAAA